MGFGDWFLAFYRNPSIKAVSPKAQESDFQFFQSWMPGVTEKGGKLLAVRGCCFAGKVMGTCVIQLSSVRNTVKWTIRWTFQIVHPPNYPFNYSSKTSKMTPDRAINYLGTIKYLLDAAESPQRFLTDACESALLYSSSPTISSMEFVTNWLNEIFHHLKYCWAHWEFLREVESSGAFSHLCFRALV